MNEVHFLIIKGKVFENNVYQPKAGFESTVAVRYENNSDFQVVLMNSGGQDILSVPAATGSYCATDSSVRKYRLAACIPLHPEAVSYEIRCGDWVLYHCDFEPKPPELKFKKSKNQNGQFSIHWDCKHSKDVSFKVLVKMQSGRKITVAKSLKKEQFKIDLSAIRASGKGQVFIVANDGVRSAEVEAGSFDLPALPPAIHIIFPGNTGLLPFGQPVSIVVSCNDIDGNLISPEFLECKLNGEFVVAGTAYIALENLKPGKQNFEVLYTGELGRSSANIDFEVDAPDAAYFHWLSLMENS